MTPCSRPSHGDPMPSPRWPGGVARPAGSASAPPWSRSRRGLRRPPPCKPSPSITCRGAPHPGPGRVRAPGGGRLVRPALRPAAGPHARVRQHRAPGPRPGRAGGERRSPLPDPLPRPGITRVRQATAPHHPPAAGRPAHLAGHRGAQERGPHRRDRRRVAGHLLLAAGGRHVQRLARRGVRPPGSTHHSPELRNRGQLRRPYHRRPGARPSRP